MTFEPGQDRWRQVVVGRAGEQRAVTAPRAADHHDVAVRLTAGTVARRVRLAAFVEV
ncbi:MAG: hypothetical protein WAW17_15055 [Rhodococcus sp. (in: high G+C Gram-positive bacteria)]|uniref:hypothetical protein n=1 Tax=Rhodococcus sp. TaxID=1831 RepID=UPI003BB17555